MKSINEMHQLTRLTVSLALCASFTSHVSAGVEPFVGEISFVGFNYAPSGWAKCDGQELPVNQNAALFSLLGTAYGGDGIKTFKLPDMRGRVPVHQGQGLGGSNYSMGQTGGNENITLSINNMPAHSHPATAISTSTSTMDSGAQAISTLKAANVTADATGAANNAIANSSAALTKIYSSSTAPDVSMHQASIQTTLSNLNIATTTTTAITVGNSGNSQPFSILQPFVVVNCIIATDGIYPARP
ncbi:MAG: phage tail protein [Nitrosomonas sp.]|nr:MAG: phage tail protein [Nitrosomonas sp.]